MLDLDFRFMESILAFISYDNKLGLGMIGGVSLVILDK